MRQQEAMTPEQRRDAWLAERDGRTYRLRDDGWHELRELGVLVAQNPRLGDAVDTAIRRARTPKTVR